MARQTRFFFWIAEVLLLAPAIFVIEVSHAYECSDYIQLWGWSEETVDLSTWADVWMIVVGIFQMSMALQWHTVKQSDYVFCRLCSFTLSTVVRILIHLGGVTGCVYTPMFVYSVSLIPLRLMEHFSDS
tara:strand:+ start:149 stop:535 length:387 start_codon:yes stop_codon:yes gene_type:complete